MSWQDAFSYAVDRIISAPKRAYLAITQPGVKQLVTVDEAKRTQSFDEYSRDFVSRVFEDNPVIADVIIDTSGKVNTIAKTPAELKKKFLEILPAIIVTLIGFLLVALIAFAVYSAVRNRTTRMIS